MPQTPKIATCTYCGTRAALVFKESGRHELACSACGAPLHDLKHMPRARKERVKVVHVPVYKNAKPKKKKRRKGWSRRFAEELFDVVEDIFD